LRTNFINLAPTDIAAIRNRQLTLVFHRLSNRKWSGQLLPRIPGRGGYGRSLGRMGQMNMDAIKNSVWPRNTEPIKRLAAAQGAQPTPAPQPQMKVISLFSIVSRAYGWQDITCPECRGNSLPERNSGHHRCPHCQAVLVVAPPTGEESEPVLAPPLPKTPPVVYKNSIGDIECPQCNVSYYPGRKDGQHWCKYCGLEMKVEPYANRFR